MGENKNTISRRKFLIATGGATIFVSGYYLVPKLFGSEGISPADREPVEKKIDVWVRLMSDDQVIIYTPAAEMGQGSMTSVPVILAEEMDADWSKVTILSSPVDAEKYGVGWYPGGQKNMVTAGSRTVRRYYHPMREAGARIRKALLQNAAQNWGVNIDELTTSPGIVLHAKSNRKLSYGQIAEFGNFDVLPEISEIELKDPKEFKLIGKVLPRYEIPLKTNGAAIYAMDVQLPGMMYGFINRSPVHGSKPELANEAEIMSIDGVHSVVKLDHGIGVVASTIESGLKAKNRMQIQWSDAPAMSHDSAEDLALYSKQGAAEENKVGDLQKATGAVVRTFDEVFTNAYVYHAQMEPLNAVVSVSSNPRRAELWIGSQAPDAAQAAVAQALEMDQKDVEVHQLFLGGGFGRRSLSGYAEECAMLARGADAPVKLIWTREDDLGYGAFRPQVKHFLKAGVDKAGKIISWEHTAVGPGGGLSEGGASVSHYDIPNLRFSRKNMDHGIRTKHWRGVGHGPNKFAIETFIDQIARSQNTDPYLYRRDMMQGNERARRVLERAAEISNWDPMPKDGMAMGMAFADRDSYSCGVAQISLNRESGEIRVHNYWCALDAGVVVQPDNAVAQVEGAVMMGISSSLKEQIQFKAGKVVQSNFHNYPILRMSEAPEAIMVDFIHSEEAPEGLGEAGLPAVGGAIASAFAALTGKHLRNMPFTPERVLEVLKS
jgi:isoquinoline 1-oxidoreductase beta subunit